MELDEIKGAIADVRNDRTSTNWALITYEGENSNNVILLGKGDGGVDELIEKLQDNMVGYGLVRVHEKFDESDIVRFVYVNWVGEKIHRMLRARLGTHSGAIKEIISPYHVDLPATTPDEISEKIVRDLVRKNAGTKSSVLERSSPASPATSAPGAKTWGQGGAKSSSGASKPVGVSQQSSGVRFADEQEVRAALQDVRSDTTDTNWALVTYDAPQSNTLVLLGKGSGGSEELIEHLKDDIVAYGLVRQMERFEESDRVMFAFINWIGENVHRMQRAKLGTHSGAIKDLFQPYHADINAANLSEISSEGITQTIRDVMGTATRVRN